MDHHLCLQLFPTVNFSTILLIFPEAWLYFRLPKYKGNLYICSIAFLITLGTTRSTTLPPSRNAWAILFSAILFYLRTSVEELVLRFKVVKEILTVSWPAYAKLHLFRNLPFLFFLSYFFFLFFYLTQQVQQLETQHSFLSFFILFTKNLKHSLFGDGDGFHSFSFTNLNFPSLKIEGEFFFLQPICITPTVGSFFSYAFCSIFNINKSNFFFIVLMTVPFFCFSFCFHFLLMKMLWACIYP